MTTLAILCSGQGFQTPDMFDLVADAPEAEPVFAAATMALDARDPRAIARDGDPEEMHRNRTAQILCCTQALAAAAALRPRLDVDLVVAGYSVGELAAWGVAGLFDPPAIFQLAAERAAAMDAATSAPSGLAAVRGLGRPAVEDLCNRHGAFIAIVNAADQMVVGGPCTALDALLAAAEAAGAERMTRLPVGVPSHTPLLAEAAVRFEAALRRQQLASRTLDDRLLSGIDGAPVFDVDEGLGKLARQIAQTVDWAACMEECRSAGAVRALELGPGRALARLMGGVIGEHDSRSLADFHTIEGVVRWTTREL